jgi:hypothetical protein
MILGISAAVIGAGGPLALPQAPSSIQSNSTVQAAGVWLIDNGNWLVLIGIVLIAISAFVTLS